MLTDTEIKLQKELTEQAEEYLRAGSAGDFIHNIVVISKKYGYISKNIKNRLYTGPLE